VSGVDDAWPAGRPVETAGALTAQRSLQPLGLAWKGSSGEHPFGVVVDAPESLVGRDAEIARISSFLDDVPTGPIALLIAGEAGIGKTSVWGAGLRIAAERSFRVLVTRPAESDIQLPFSGLDDLLHEALSDVLPDLPPPQQRALSAALLLEDSGTRPPDVRSLSVACREALRLLARQSPVLIAVDDIQWLDEPSVTVLTHALRRLDADPIGLLGTVRGGGDADRRFITAVPRARAARLSLGPLALGAIHRLVIAQFKQSMPRPTLVRIHELSGGNPFFALEIVRALLSRGGTVRPGEPFPVPEDLQGLLRLRLDGLPAEARAVLPVVALLADRSIAVIHRIAPSAAPGLEGALDADVLRVEAERVRFTHPLLASAVLSRLLPETVRALHRRIAAHLDDPEERARHLALGTEAPDAFVAEALDHAARHAVNRGAPNVAAELKELAASLTPDHTVEDRRRRTLDAARSWSVSGDLQRAIAMASEMLAEPLTPSERADTLLFLAEARVDDVAELTRLAEEALAQSSGDVRRSITALRLLADAHLQRGDLKASDVDARKALELAETERDPRLLVPVLAVVSLNAIFAGDPQTEMVHRAVAMEDETPGLQGYDSPTVTLAWWLMCQDRLDEARSRFHDALARTLAAGDQAARQAMLLHLVELECRAGNWIVALRLADEMVEGAEQFGMAFQGAAALYPRALVDACLGRVEEARAAASEGLASSQASHDEIFEAQNASVLGFIELSLGNAAAADRYLRPVADRLEELGWGEPSVYRVLPNAIEALVAIGELDEARRLLRRLEKQGRAARSRWAEACAGRCRGLVLAAEGNLHGALRALDKALKVHELIPVPFEHARTLLVLGICQRRAKQWAAARRSMQRALDTFRTLGARLWAERAEVELGRIGGRAASPLELTETERRVASLVAEGLSNREVADRLFVSVRTVEGHLSGAYRKLGVRSRTELARELRPEADVRSYAEERSAQVKST
jgi:DNA-binding CsgD family transcriptional regulator